MSDKGRIVAVGHVGLGARDLEGLARFYKDTMGLKQIVYHAGVVAIFEVGDVDLFLSAGDPVDLELAADDVDAMRDRLVAAGVACEDARDNKQSGHRAFGFLDPDGNRIRITSAHPRSRA